MSSRRNSHCKINTLPVEILREIFLSVCEYGLRQGDFASIIKTCKQWYSVLIRDPAAYSTVNVGDRGCNRRIAEIFAERSIPLPLSIARANTGRGTSLSRSNWERQFCKKHLSRVKSLEYSQLFLADEQWLCELRAPQLERCKLSRFVYGTEEQGDDDEEDQEGSVYEFDPQDYILPCLFGGDAPKLHILEFHDVRLAWCPGNYSNLTQLNITFHPGLIAQVASDSDNVTIVFQGSPRLEQVEFTTSCDEKWWKVVGRWNLNPDLEVVHPRCDMRHLHTLRLHLSVSYVILVLRAIEVTHTIRTVELHCISSNDMDSDNCLKVLDVDLLRDFLFTNLRSLAIIGSCWDSSGKSTLIGSGLFGDHPYSLLVYLPLENPSLLMDKIASQRHMVELERLVSPEEPTNALVKLLAASPAVDEVDFIVCRSIGHTTSDLHQLLSDTQNLPQLSKISHWAFMRCQRTQWTEHSTQDGIDQLKAFFRRLPCRPRALSVDAGFIPTAERSLGATWEFLVDLARLNVAVAERIEANPLEEDQIRAGRYVCEDYSTRYISFEDFWPGGNAPLVVQEIMQKVETVRRLLASYTYLRTH